MLRTGSNISRVWSRFTVKKANNTLKLLIRDLPKNRINDYSDFQLKHFAKYDIIHIAAGLFKNQEAAKEYSHIITEYLKVHLKGVTICCRDDESDKSEIIAISGMKLRTLNDNECPFEKNGEIKTKEAASIFRSTSIMQSIYPVSELMRNFGIDRYYDDTLGIGVHEDYWGHGICEQILCARMKMCQEYNIPMSGGWTMAYGSQISTKRDGWETVFKITSKELEQLLGVTLRDPPKYIKYVVNRTKPNAPQLKA